MQDFTLVVFNIDEGSIVDSVIVKVNSNTYLNPQDSFMPVCLDSVEDLINRVNSFKVPNRTV